LAHESRGRDAKGIWLALCCEYGVLLGANRKWRWRFAQELTSIGGDEKRRYRERSNSELNTLFRRGLEHLDHLEQDLYPPQSTSVYRGLKVTSKLEDSARRQVYSDPEPERPYRSESTPGSLDPKIADEPDDTAGLYGYSGSQSGKFHPLGLASKRLRPFVLDSKPVPAA